MYEFGRCSTFSFVAYPLLSIAYMICAYVRPEFCTVIKLINILVGLLFAYNVAALLIERSICKPNKFLSSAAFFIYVSHFLIYNEVLKILFLILSQFLYFHCFFSSKKFYFIESDCGKKGMNSVRNVTM